MKTPEERSLLFVEEVVALAEKSFDRIQFDCDRRRGSFQSCIPVTEARIYDKTSAHAFRFTPIAIVSIVDPENPRFQVKTRSEIKDYTAGQLENGLVDQLKVVHLGGTGNRWVFMDTASTKSGAKAKETTC